MQRERSILGTMRNSVKDGLTVLTTAQVGTHLSSAAEWAQPVVARLVVGDAPFAVVHANVVHPAAGPVARCHGAAAVVAHATVRGLILRQE